MASSLQAMAGRGLLCRSPSKLLSPNLLSPGLFELELGDSTCHNHACNVATFANSGCFDRRWSQIAMGPQAPLNVAACVEAGANVALRKLLLLCCSCSPFACKLTVELQRLRDARSAPCLSQAPPPLPAGGSPCSSASSPGRGAAPSPACGGASPPGGSPASSEWSVGSSDSLSPLVRGCSFDLAGDGGGSADVDAIARDLVSAGYLVQIRDQAASGRPKDARRCLQQLRHRFIVCLGAAARPGAAAWWGSASAGPPAAPGGPDGAVPGAPRAASAPGAMEAMVMAAAGLLCPGDIHFLPEPLVVEPRFRDQFVIAHPTPAYQALLEAVPQCFVGTMERLEAVVSLLCDEMAAAFKEQGLAIPPWRTKQANLSKWVAPQPAAADLSAKLACALGGAPAAAPAAAAPAPQGPRRPLQGPAAPCGAAPAVVTPAAAGAGAGALQFARHGSAEWKTQQPLAPGSKAKSLLAAALRDSSSPRICTPTHAAAARLRAAGAAPVAAGAEAARGPSRAQGDCSGAAIRTVPNEKGFGCITTVRWGTAQHPRR